MTSRDDGFTLLETLLALGVLSGVLVMFGVGIIGSWRGISRSEAEMRALAVARGLIETAGVETPLSAGASDGVTIDGLVYRINVAPYDADAASERSSLFWVSVAVTPRSATGGAGRPLVLRTLKTGPAP